MVDEIIKKLEEADRLLKEIINRLDNQHTDFSNRPATPLEHIETWATEKKQNEGGKS